VDLNRIHIFSWTDQFLEEDRSRSVPDLKTIKERTKLGLARARANGRIGDGRYKLSPTQQAEAIKMIRLGAKSQAEIAELFNVDRSTISRMMKEVREKELLKTVR
jgi:DNA invertase Pin-like site-specific DNA recombinase